MRLGSFSLGSAVLLVWRGSAMGQPAARRRGSSRSPLQLTMPEPYQVTAVLEPIRRVTLVAPPTG